MITRCEYSCDNYNLLDVSYSYSYIWQTQQLENRKIKTLTLKVEIKKHANANKIYERLGNTHKHFSIAFDFDKNCLLFFRYDDDEKC
jgi:hypothetical protein